MLTLKENKLTFSFSFQTQSNRQRFSPVLELHTDDEVDDAKRLEDVLVEEPQLVIQVLAEYFHSCLPPPCPQLT